VTEAVLQDTVQSAWCSRDRFDASRSKRASLLAILRRRVADRWRRSDHEVGGGERTHQEAADLHVGETARAIFCGCKPSRHHRPRSLTAV